VPLRAPFRVTCCGFSEDEVHFAAQVSPQPLERNIIRAEDENASIVLVLLALTAVSCNSSLGPTEIKDVFSVYLVDLSSETISVPNPALADLVLESEPLLSIALSRVTSGKP